MLIIVYYTVCSPFYKLLGGKARWQQIEQNLLLMWRLHGYMIAKLYRYTKHLNLCMMQCNACCKCENDSRCSHSYLEPWWGRMVTLRQAG